MANGARVEGTGVGNAAVGAVLRAGQALRGYETPVECVEVAVDDEDGAVGPEVKKAGELIAPGFE
jgi:hypothetical protein